MKRIWIFFLLLLALIVFTACTDSETNGNHDTNEEEQDDDTNDEDTTDDTNDEDTTDDTNDSDDEDDDERLAALWSWYYGSSKGNTSGNLINGGRVTHDFTEKKHYISAQQKLYLFDPITGDKEVLYDLVKGHATHLNTAGDYLYFIHDDEGELYRFHLKDHTIERRLAEGNQDAFFLHRMQTRYHVLHYGTHGVEWGLYRPNDNWIIRRTSNITRLSEHGGRVYLMNDDNLVMQVRDGGQGAGSNWIDFEAAYNFETIDAYVVLNFSDQYRVNMAMIVDIGSDAGVYMFYDAQEDPLVPIKTGTLSSFSNLNFDGTYVYFLYDATLYRFIYDAPDSLEAYRQLEGNIVEMNIINHWVYYRLHGSSTIYQVHPDTGQIHAFD